MYAHAIAQVDETLKGIHLIWYGPRPWGYSLQGWFIQRRPFKGKQTKPVCDALDEDVLGRLRETREIVLRTSIATLRDGFWPIPIAPPVGAPTDTKSPAEVLMFELHKPQSWVRIELTAKRSFVFALREGKVVATGGESRTGSMSYELRGLNMDTVVVYALLLKRTQICVVYENVDEKSWNDVPYIVKALQLPIRELIPSLGSEEDEYNEATTRLLPGETLDREDFTRLADTLRIGAGAAGPPRPIDQVLLMREDAATDFEELVALDPIRTLLSHPKWRRVLGFSWFDGEPGLVPGEIYEYRITGFFPEEDLSDAVYGFHTVPSTTTLPKEFYLKDLHLRLPQPATVDRAPGTGDSGRLQITRRGIRLKPQSQFYWLPPSLDDWSLVIDFPSPVGAVVLELHENHTLEYVWGEAWGPMDGPAPVPSGLRSRLEFPTPVAHLRLRGNGFLYAIRIPTGDEGVKQVSVVLPPVELVDTPLPEPPLTVTVANLQQPQPVPVDDMPTTTSPTRHALGMEVNWLPAPSPGITDWPADDQSAPPLDATIFQIEHRQQPEPTWTPLLPEENWTMGDRDRIDRDTNVFPGVDLLALFPEVIQRAPGAGWQLFWRDVFDFREGGNEVIRPVPEPGTMHRYRVRTVDAIGRPSASWRESGVLQLQKHVPPPIPVGPSETPADALEQPEPTGVQARTLVRDAPDLTPEDEELLGGDDNAIILRWGWHSQQREQDPYAREFRIYVADKPLDAVPGQLTQVTTLADGIYAVTLALEREVLEDAARASNLNAGYPFYIHAHSAGETITAQLRTRIPGKDGSYPVPRIGPISLPLHLTPALTRPPAWTERVHMEPLTTDTEYEVIIRNRLTLTPGEPRDTRWVGVSAADDQDYVPDQLAPADIRPGNESAIVPVFIEARYQRRPEFDIPPPLDPVPRIITPEPDERSIFFELDLGPYLDDTGLTPSDLIRPERASAASVFTAYYISDDERIMGKVIDRRDDEEDSEVVVGNPDDRAAIVTGLNAARTDALDDRFVVFLAGAHPYRDRLFEPAVQTPVALGPFQETLPPQTDRYVYRVRKSDAAHHLSAGGAMAKVVVRIPSMAPGAAPEKLPAQPDDPPGTLRIRVAPEPELTHLLAFSQVATGVTAGPLPAADLLRVPNAQTHYPDDGIRLRAPDGELLVPLVKPLADDDVIIDADGFRLVTLNFSAGAGERIRVWAYAMTRDGIPSLPGGPWGLAMPLAPLPEPTLLVSSTPPILTFEWSWPGDKKYNVSIERSEDESKWVRVSPVLPETTSQRDLTPPPESWFYRLAVMSPDGRVAYSNTVST